MSRFVYVVETDSLSHALAKYSVQSRSSYSQSKQTKASRTSQASNIRELRQSQKRKPGGGVYKSPYYDPVERHERYMRERSSLGIGLKGSSGPLAGSSTSSGRGRSGSNGKSASKGSKGRAGGKGSASNIAAAIAKLSEESSLNTEAQQEAARRKIEDLKEELKAQIEALSSREADVEEGVNTAEIRGRIQSIRDEIQRTGGDLQKWITQEKEALERRIAAAYNSNGQQYKIPSQSDKKNASEARDKEVKSRADSIYKKKS